MNGIKYLGAYWFVVCLVLVAGCWEGNPCPEGSVLCDNVCAVLATDANHCGACNNACGPYADCVEGVCVCINGFTYCDGECVYPLNDEDHCGACDNACRAAQVCSDGRCTCFGSNVECGNRCTDLDSDPENCGACARRCTPNQVCNQGQCAKAETGQLGDPCPYENVNVTANYCMPGLECLGIPAHGNGEECPGGESSECTSIYYVWNRDCVDGNCGASFCSKKVDNCAECPPGYDPTDVNGACYCIPAPPGGGNAGDPCPWGSVNIEYLQCGYKQYCMGNDNAVSCPGGSATVVFYDRNLLECMKEIPRFEGEIFEVSIFIHCSDLVCDRLLYLWELER